MKITIDTKADSKDEIKKAIEFLKSIINIDDGNFQNTPNVESSPSETSSFAENFGNFFNPVQDTDDTSNENNDSEKDDYFIKKEKQEDNNDDIYPKMEIFPYD